MKVAIVGATGETGSSIVNGLLASTVPNPRQQEVTALIRPSSLQKPEVRELEARGIEVVACDLTGPEDELVKKLTGIDVVISPIVVEHLFDQIPLANAAKKAGVKRFVPSFFATVMPPRGMMWFHDQKEDVVNHIQTIFLPYTIINVGWWYQITLPRLPSGRIDAVSSPFDNWIAGDGNVKSALTDLRDVGKYVARIIADPRTINKRVFAYTELRSQNEVYDLIENLSGEKLQREYVRAKPWKSADDIEADIVKAKDDTVNPHKLSILQYRKSWGLRGDNTPEYARYLGYLIGKELYPDLEGKPFEEFCKEALDGKLGPIFAKKIREATEAAQQKAASEGKA
ncbi:isoflavone reductase family protein [Colletotrichum sojae]|uniref:Isoflavone reductase family protein n=1 Tax=Colletotrichum sojae TaxID=2175907 RepID=A0A8H6IS18_9PEZI|nr:isoflavone reductase family protein [Colletotrichum sojae]